MKTRIPPDMQAWIDARKRHRLSHDQVQMARELGMNPKKLGKIDNHRQERWKAPLPQFIEYLYLKRFRKERPEVVMTIEETCRRNQEKKELKRRNEPEIRQRAAETSPGPAAPTPD